MLAPILGVSLDELNHGCDDPFDANEIAAVLKPVTIRVFGEERSFEYHMTLRTGLNLELPAVYQHWADMFSPWPASLARHFGHINASLYGWVPGLAPASAAPALGALVLLDANRRKLDPIGTVDPHTWFIYVPGGVLTVGKAMRDGRSLILIPLRKRAERERHPLTRVDVVGRVSGRPLLAIVAVE